MVKCRWEKEQKRRGRGRGRGRDGFGAGGHCCSISGGGWVVLLRVDGWRR